MILFLVVVSVGHSAFGELGGFRLELFWAFLDLLKGFNRTLLFREVQERKCSLCC